MISWIATLSWWINDSNTRIRISTKEVKANTQQVLAGLAQMGKPLRLHRPSRVASCLPDFVYRKVWLIPESRLSGWVVYPLRNSKRSFWANAKASTSSSSTNVLCLLFYVFKLDYVFMRDLYLSWRINDSNTRIRISYRLYSFIEESTTKNARIRFSTK